MKSSALTALLALSVLSTAVAALNSTTNPAEKGIITNGQVALGDWRSAFDKAKALTAQLTTDEKITIITAGSLASNASVDWTALAVTDGPSGAQEYYYESAFSIGNALGMTWDKASILNQSKAVATEAYQKGIQCLAGPISQPLGRTVWGGRGGESYGPDVYLNGIASGLMAKGFVAGGVIPGAKHFLLYEQETNRTSSVSGGGRGVMGGGFGGSSFSGNSSSGTSPSGSASMGSPTASGFSTIASGATSSLSAISTGSAGFSDQNSTLSSSSSSSDSAPYSSNANDKTIHETYMWPWYDMVKSGIGAAMCAMTEVNGTAACEDSDLLMGLLKTEVGYPGLVLPDINAQKTALGSAIGGLDYGSSNVWTTDVMTTMLNNGSLSQARLDDMVIRNVIGYFYANLDNGEQPAHADTSDYIDTMGDHADLIRKIGAKSIVLLKNVNNALPLSKPHRMSVFGAHAGPVMGGPNLDFDVQGSGPVYDGHLATGSGSAQASFPYLITPIAALTTRAAKDHTNIKWILNDTYSEGTSKNTLVTLGSDDTGISPSYSAYAVASDVCLVFINALAGEGTDRTELYNEDQDTMVATVAANCNNTIVIITTTGARLVDQWIENDNITAVLYSAPLGQESGNSITDVLYGATNPSARLIYTIAKNESDYNVGICDTKQCNFTEGNYIDYKYFDAYNVTPRYEFGYGLSYTTFKYSSLQTAVASNNSSSSSSSTNNNLSYHATGNLEVGGRTDLWDIVAHVTVSVTNSGILDGAEVPQLYIGYPADSDAKQPIRALRGFERVEIGAGATQRVSFALRRRDLSFWDVRAQEWALPKGRFTVSVGASSRDLRLTGSLTLA